jgi:phage FluMu gp28-like protein
MVDSVQSDESDDDKVDGNDVIQQARQNQNQNACDKRNDRGKMLGSEGHGDFLWAVCFRLRACWRLVASNASSLALCAYVTI